MLMLLVIFILLAAWVLDWVYLVLVQRNMQQRMDLVALAGTPALLDEDLLRDAAGAPSRMSATAASSRAKCPSLPTAS